MQPGERLSGCAVNDAADSVGFAVLVVVALVLGMAVPVVQVVDMVAVLDRLVSTVLAVDVG